MDNSQTLELQIKSKAQEAITSLDSLISKLTGVEKSVSNIESKLKSNSVKSTANDINQLASSTDKATANADKLGKSLKAAFTFAGVKKLTSTLLGWMKEAIDYTEQLNLFNVVFDNIEKNGVQTFSKLGGEATKFQYKLNEAFGTNKTQTLYMQGIFQSMGETVGIPDNYSAIMSETMTKLTYDLASLYNKTETATAEAIRAGVYAGQTKPLRSYGIDVTQMSMQPIVNELGITNSDGEIKAVKEFSQAEKEILRYIATMKQAQIAMGDLANTIESPSNQLKVFRQQLTETKTALSSLFIGTFSTILPYANAILMVIKEVSKAIASMFGIKLKDYNSGIASVDKYSDGIGSVGSSADKAKKKVKELKREIFDFDEIHNINENKDNGSSGGSGSGGTAGGIDQRLLDAIKGYDNGMDKVRMKATQIRDKIMEWLGFHKKINPLTGEVYFEYQGIKKTLENMWKSFKGLSTEGKVLVGLGLVVGATKLWNIGKKLITVFGNSGLGKVLKTALIPFKTLGTNMLNLIQYTRVYNSLTKSMKNGILGGVEAWRQQNIIVKDAYGNTDKLKTAMNGAKTAVQGLITGAVGLYTVNKSMKSISTEGTKLSNVLGLVTGSLTTIASGVQIGAIFGGWGPVIGGAVGALLSLVSAMQGYQTESDKIITSSKSIIDSTTKIKDQYKAIEETYASESAMHLYYDNLLTELDKLVDANGNVKKGYEERANFIVTTLNNAYGTEMKIVDGKILNYEKEVDGIKKIIAEKQKQIALELAEEKYKVALDNKTESYKNLKNAKKDLTSAEKDYKDALDRTINRMNKMSDAQKQKLIDTYGSIEAAAKEETSYHKTADALEEAQKAYKNASDVYSYNVETIMTYQDILTADTEKDTELIKQKLNEMTSSHVENGKVIKDNYTDQIKDAQLYYDEYIDLAKKNNVKITDDVKAFANERYNAVVGELVKETSSIGKNGKVSKDLAEAWYTLGKTNKDKFLEKFQDLNPDIQQKIINKMYSQGYSISSELQAGIQSFNPEIKIKADTSQAKKSVNDLVKEITGAVSGAFAITIGKKAKGGVYSNGSWKDIPQYANGGSPSHGTMFVAGEHGAEIVGHINGKTEVLNQSQIASAIYSAVASAMSQYSGQGVAEINVHASDGLIVETAINGINQTTKQTGVCPINI